MPTPLYSMDAVCFGFKKGAPPFFNELQFNIHQGERLAVLGPAGSGKSTLLKLLVGLLKPWTGEVRFKGEAILTMGREARRQLARQQAMTFQNSGLFDSFSCAENLLFPLREHTKLSDKERRRKVSRALDEVGLSGVEALKVHELSGGMQKRLGIARALILEPEVVLFDDPTAGLDPITSHSILELIQRTQAKKDRTIVLVTADVTRALTFVERAAVLVEGRLVALDSAQAILESQQPTVYRFLRGIAEKDD